MLEATPDAIEREAKALSIFPCPFCASTVVEHVYEEDADFSCCRCWSCKAQGPRKAGNRRNAVDGWNRMIPGQHAFGPKLP